MKKAWDDESQLSPIGTSIDPVESFTSSKDNNQEKMKIQFKKFQKKVKIVRVQSSRKDRKSSKKKLPGRVRRSKKRGGRNNMPPLPFTKAKTAPVLRFTRASDLQKEINIKVTTIWQKYYLKKILNHWKDATLNSNMPKEESKTSQNYASQGRHKKKVSELIQKPFSVLLLNNLSPDFMNTSKQDVNLKENQEKIEEDTNPISDKEIITNALKDYNTRANDRNSGFKVFQISKTAKHEMSKSAMIGDEDQDIESKRRQFDKSFSKVKINQIPGFKREKSNLKPSKKKTKQAMRRYKEISSMLEKIQREANQLSTEYQNTKDSNN